MNPTEKQHDSQYILYDADQLNSIDPSFFNPEILAQKGLLRGSAEGRGTAHFIELDGNPCVLRHYRRGGWAAKLLGDRYLRTALPETRAWREWYLLAELFKHGLPVPQPVAARVITGNLFYQADLITLRLKETQPLSKTLQKNSLPDTQWYAIGQCIRSFHNIGVYHSDLNAHNILLDLKQTVYLIDFDKSGIRTNNISWQQANLARLRRSLDKLSGQHVPFHFNDSHWKTLIAGWHS